MNAKLPSQDINTLKRTNSELKRAIRHFIDIAPSSGTLEAQINNIKSALRSNDAVFTFASLVEQYARMKKNFDNLEYQAQQKNVKAFTAKIKVAFQENLPTEQREKIESISSAIAEGAEPHELLANAGNAIEAFAQALNGQTSNGESAVGSDTQGAAAPLQSGENKAALIKLTANLQLLTTNLANSFPDDEVTQSLKKQSAKLSKENSSLTEAVNLLESTTKFLVTMVDKQRLSTIEILRGIHANLLEAFNNSAVVKKIAKAVKGSSDAMVKDMTKKLKEMESKAKKVDTLQGMQQHLNVSIKQLAKMINEFSKKQQALQLTNENNIKQLTEQLATSVEFVSSLEQKLDDIEQKTLSDELTTVGNRRGYELKINEYQQQWAATKQPLTIMVIDIDHFKTINDTFGHTIGDQVLKSLGKTMKKSIRSSDYIARYGGEEFVIVLPDTELDFAAQLAKKLKETVNSLKFELRKKNKVLKTTCSFGIASFSDQLTTGADVFAAADKALYHAKENGRDAVAVITDSVSLDAEIA